MRECQACQKMKPHEAKGLCQACYSRRYRHEQRKREGYVRTAKTPSRPQAKQETRLRCGLEIRTLNLSVKEEEAERCRRAEIYRRQVEEFGCILWGRVEPHPEDRREEVAHGCEVSDDWSD